MARSGRGMRCALDAFIRSAGIVHTFALISISLQTAPYTSPDRAAVNIANSSARAAVVPSTRNRAMNEGSSAYAMAAKCPRASLGASGGGERDAPSIELDSPQSAALALLRHRGRPRFFREGEKPISGFSSQIGLSTSRIAAVSTSSTWRALSERAPFRSDTRHCSRCFPFRHSEDFASSSASAIWPNVFRPASVLRLSRRASIGLMPARIAFVLRRGRRAPLRAKRLDTSQAQIPAGVPAMRICTPSFVTTLASRKDTIRARRHNCPGLTSRLSERSIFRRSSRSPK